MIEPQNFYAQTEAQYQNLWTATSRKANIIAMLRLLAMVLLLSTAYYFIKNQNWVAIGTVCTSLAVAFFALVVYHTRTKEQVLRAQILIQINRNEQTYLSGDTTPFEDGTEFINPEHPYSFDLDIFGNQSIFQSLNRTTTPLGKMKLAQRLENSELTDIAPQQKAVAELAANPIWRQNFQTAGLLYTDKNERLDGFKFWLNKPIPLSERSILRVLSFVLPAATIVVLVLSFTSDAPFLSELFKWLGIANLLVVGSQYKLIKEEREHLTQVTASFQRYANILQVIENQSFHADILRGLQSFGNLDVTSNHAETTASRAIKQLSQLLNQFDSLFNPLAALLANGLFQYHIHTLYALAKWKRTYGGQVLKWFDAIAEFEVLASLGNFAFNHSAFIFPSENPLNTEGVLMMKNVGHPLIPKDKRVGNDVTFDPNTFIILTGSNMSGKSTFLRTLGVNLVLAKAAAPVCASQFQFSPYPIFISMRVSDSLQNSESFFFAELKRLKRIINQLEAGQKTVVILDEILRGTNSNDKRAGTIGLIKNLLAHQAIGIIATHDLAIGDMTAQYPDSLQNKCFEVELSEAGLVFDYKLKQGVAQQMSAAFLMQKMGIVA